MLSRAGRHIFVDCCVLTSELTFWVFSFYFVAQTIFILCFHFCGIPVDFLPLFDFVQGSQPIRAKENNMVRNLYKTVSSGAGEPKREYSFLYT